MRRLHPASIVVALLPRFREAIQASIPLLIGSFASGHRGNQDWIAIFIGAFTGVFAIGTYLTTRFEILPDHVSYKTGWLFKKDRRIPIEQIQNVNIRQNLLERLFKVATVNVETALGHARDLNLSVLGLAEAEHLREELLGATRSETTDIPIADDAIVRLNKHDLLWGALTENHLPQMVVGMMTLGGSTLGITVRYASKLEPVMAAAAFGAGLALLAIGTWIWGAANYFMKYGDFVVRRKDGLLRISHGLLNKVQLAVRPGRIEYLQLTTTLFQRFLARSNLKVGTASTFGETGVLAPLALYVEQHVAFAGAAHTFHGFRIEALEWQPFSPVFYIRRVTRTVISIAIFLGGAAAFVSRTEGHGAIPIWSFAGVLTAISLSRIFSLFLARPENTYAFNDHVIVVRQGYFQQSILAIPIERIETISITQPMWWKSRKAHQLMVQAMKHRLHVPAIGTDAIEDLLSRWKTVAKAHDDRLAAQPDAPEPTSELLTFGLEDVIVEESDELSESNSF